MKNNSYLFKTIGVMILTASVLWAFDNEMELNGSNSDGQLIKSSIQLEDDATEINKKTLAKIDVGDVIDILQDRYEGKIVQVKLEENNRNLVYEVEILGKNDILKDVIVDAGNGKILLSKIDISEQWPWSEFAEYGN